MWKWDWSVESCLSEHTLKTKLTHFKSHKIKVTAIVYWESVKLMIFSTEWIFHARWWSLDTLPNILYPIFHVRMSTSERRSVNHNSNLIKVVILPQCVEKHHRKPTSQYWANTTTLMRFEFCHGKCMNNVHYSHIYHDKTSLCTISKLDKIIALGHDWWMQCQILTLKALKYGCILLQDIHSSIYSTNIKDYKEYHFHSEIQNKVWIL